MKEHIEAYLLAGMKIASRNPQITAYEALRQVYNYIKDSDNT